MILCLYLSIHVDEGYEFMSNEEDYEAYKTIIMYGSDQTKFKFVWFIICLKMYIYTLKRFMLRSLIFLGNPKEV